MKQPLERIIITPIAAFAEEAPLFVATGGTMKAPLKTAITVLSSPSLCLKHIRRPKHNRHIELYNSAFSPSDTEVSCRAWDALLGKLERIKLYRVIIQKYYILFEFYNGRENQLSSLQPNVHNMFAFTIECNGNSYRVRYKYSMQESCMVATVKVKKAGQLLYHRQPLYVYDFDEE